jgi:hypothetical protein
MQGKQSGTTVLNGEEANSNQSTTETHTRCSMVRLDDDKMHARKEESGSISTQRCHTENLKVTCMAYISHEEEEEEETSLESMHQQPNLRNDQRDAEKCRN